MQGVPGTMPLLNAFRDGECQYLVFPWMRALDTVHFNSVSEVAQIVMQLLQVSPYVLVRVVHSS